jgi:hypothetical protein
VSRRDAAVYCPQGTGSKPVDVQAGYYTLGGMASNITRDREVQCEPGFYCKRGVKYVCPVGRYGDRAVSAQGDRTKPADAPIPHTQPPRAYPALALPSTSYTL